MSTFQIPGYEILEQIGEGGMGAVFKARQVSLGRIVAVKVLRADLAKDPAALAQFKLEANSVANLKHPNILMLHEAGEKDGTHYFVMEYVSAYSVHEWLTRKGRLSESDTLTIADAVARALQYAWDRGGLIHCDVKPDNLLVDEDGMVKVADFSGLSRTRETPEAKLVGEMTIGTPNYMAPEQVHGIEDLDHRCDIYALGALMYQLLTGQLPFGDLAPAETMQRQVSAHLPDPRDLVPDLHANVVQFIERMLVKDRARRYESWQAVLDDLALVRGGRLPRGDPPLPGSSTLRRNAESSPSPKPAGKRRVILPGHPETHRPSLAPASAPRSRKIPLLLFFALALLAVNVLLVMRLRGHRNAPVQEAVAETAVTPVPEPTPEPDPGPTDMPEPDLPTDDPGPGPWTPPKPEGDSKPPMLGPAREEPDPPAEPQPPHPDVRDFLAMIEVHRVAMDFAQRREFSQAQQVLLDWLSAHAAHPFADEVRRSSSWLLKAVGLGRILERNTAPLLGMEPPSIPGGGRIIGATRDALRIRRTLGPGGMSDSNVEYRQVSAEDMMALFHAADPAQAPLHGATLLLAQGRLTSAHPLMDRADAMGLVTDDLRAWHAAWHRISRNLSAHRAIMDAERLMKAHRFADAIPATQAVIEGFSDTRMVSEFRLDELRAWMEVASEELSFDPSAAPPDEEAEPEVAEDDTGTGDFETVALSDLQRDLSAWDGRLIRIRVGYRTGIRTGSGGMYEARLGDTGGSVAVVFPEAGYRFIRDLPMEPAFLYGRRSTNRRVFFGTVEADRERIVLSGRTRRTLMGGRGAEYTW